MAPALGERDRREGLQCRRREGQVSQIPEAQVTHILCTRPGGQQAELPQVLRGQWQAQGILCHQGAPEEAAVLPEHHLVIQRHTLGIPRGIPLKDCGAGRRSIFNILTKGSFSPLPSSFHLEYPILANPDHIYSILAKCLTIAMGAFYFYITAMNTITGGLVQVGCISYPSMWSAISAQRTKCQSDMTSFEISM